MTDTATIRRRRAGLLTATVARTICEAIAAGKTWSDAAEAAGVPAKLITSWQRRGRAATAGKYAAFAEALDAAVEEGEQALLDIVQSAATAESTETETVTTGTTPKGAKFRSVKRNRPPDWRAAVALLEMRNPARYSRKRNDREAEPAPGTAEIRLRFGVSDDEMARLKRQWIDRRREAGLPIDILDDEPRHDQTLEGS